MSDGVARFNALPREEAERILLACLPNRDWAAGVVGRRPYPDRDALLLSAGALLALLTDEDWRGVFDSHPRIGEGGGREPLKSEKEQSAVRAADDETLAALAAENRAYEERFGRVFLIAAAGRGADEILAELRKRMRSSPEAELAAAKRELRKIMLLRLEGWLDE